MKSLLLGRDEEMLGFIKECFDLGTRFSKYYSRHLLMFVFSSPVFVFSSLSIRFQNSDFPISTWMLYFASNVYQNIAKSVQRWQNSHRIRSGVLDGSTPLLLIRVSGEWEGRRRRGCCERGGDYAHFMWIHFLVFVVEPVPDRILRVQSSRS